MPIRRLLLSAALLGSLLFACDFNKTSAQVQARTVMVATLLHTPEVELKFEALAGFSGFDASFPPNDSGFTFDAGAFFADAGIIVPPQTVAFAFFGTRNGEGLSQSAPTPIAGATMTLELKGDGGRALKEIGSGTFQLTTGEDKNLPYADNQDYFFSAKAQGETFTAAVVAVPAPENIPQFHPGGRSFVELDAGTDFMFRRPDPESGQERNLAFVIVVPINRTGQQGQLTYSSLPQKPLEYLKLVLAPNDWKATTVIIPGVAFPERDTNYIVLLQSAKLGGPNTDNLFIGSAIVAGTADVAIIKTRP